MMDKDELLELIDDLCINTLYYCDNGLHEGSFRVQVYNPYIPTEKWDALQDELRQLRMRFAAKDIFKE